MLWSIVPLKKKSRVPVERTRGYFSQARPSAPLAGFCQAPGKWAWAPACLLEGLAVYLYLPGGRSEGARVECIILRLVMDTFGCVEEGLEVYA